MNERWVYKAPDSQAAPDAVLAVDRSYTPDEVTGLGLCCQPRRHRRNGRDTVIEGSP